MKLIRKYLSIVFRTSPSKRDKREGELVIKGFKDGLNENKINKGAKK